MKEAIVSKAYAKSIYQLGKEKNVDVAKELTDLNVAINENNNLETVLFLDVFTPEEKEAVMSDVMNKMNLSGLTKNTVSYLLQEGRMSLFPMIFKDLIVMDDHEKGFLRGTIEGRDDEPSAEFVTKVKSYLKGKLGADTDLQYKKNENITAGYRVTVEDLQLDASLDNQMDKLKESILNS